MPRRFVYDKLVLAEILLCKAEVFLNKPALSEIRAVIAPRAVAKRLVYDLPTVYSATVTLRELLIALFKLCSDCLKI